MKTSLILAILPLSIWVEFFMAPLLDTEYICIFDILIDLIQPLRLFQKLKDLFAQITPGENFENIRSLVTLPQIKDYFIVTSNIDSLF